MLLNHYFCFMSKTGKRYSKRKKTKAIALLERNNYDFSKVSKEVKVSVNTLKAWVSKDPIKVRPLPKVRIKAKVEKTYETTPTEVVEIITNIDHTITEYYENYIEKALDARAVVLLKILALIPRTTDIQKVSNALKTIDDSIMNNIKVSNPEIHKQENKTLSIIYNQLYPKDESKS